jgi:hypothetical protein
LTEEQKEITKEKVLELLKTQEMAIEELAKQHKKTAELFQSIHPEKEKQSLNMVRVIGFTCQILGFICLLCMFIPAVVFLLGILYAIFTGLPTT